MRKLLRTEHYHVLVANVIFTCGFAARRSTFALLPMSLLSQPRSRKTQNLAQNAQGTSEQLPVPSRAPVDVPPVVSSDPSVQEFTILIRPSKNKRCRKRPRGGRDGQTDNPPPSKYPDLLSPTPQRDEHLSPAPGRERRQLSSQPRLSGSPALPVPRGNRCGQRQHAGAPRRSPRRSPTNPRASQPRHVEATRNSGREEKWFPYHRLPGADKTSSCYRV